MERYHDREPRPKADIGTPRAYATSIQETQSLRVREYAVSEAASAPLNGGAFASQAEGHRRWVRICHWLVVASFVTLAVSGVLHSHGASSPVSGRGRQRPDAGTVDAADQQQLSSGRVAEDGRVHGGAWRARQRRAQFRIFNQNGWARSLHFLAAWIMVAVGAIYFLLGIVGGHMWRDLLPRVRELAPPALWQDLKNHLRPAFRSASAGRPYGLLQKLAYTVSCSSSCR